MFGKFSFPYASRSWSENMTRYKKMEYAEMSNNSDNRPGINSKKLDKSEKKNIIF